LLRSSSPRSATPGGDKAAITLADPPARSSSCSGPGIVVGILNSYEQFTVPALTPVLEPAIIAGCPVSRARKRGHELTSTRSRRDRDGDPGAAPAAWLYGLDDRLRLVFDWRDPAVRRVFVLMLPVTIGLGLINFNLVVNTLFASRFLDPDLSPRAIDAAFRIYMLPQGMFSVAIATVLFPRLSRLSARRDLDGFRHTVALGVRQIAFTLVPASVFSAVLATPITRIVYQHGAWTVEDTKVTASALAAFSLGLTFNGVMLMLNRAFFSLQTPWTPTAIAVGNLAVNTAPWPPVPPRYLGHPARHFPRQHLRLGGAADRVPTPAGTHRVRRHSARVLTRHRLLARARRGRLPGLVRARPGARPLGPRPGRLARLGVRRRLRRLPDFLPFAGSS
jgi:hypothetical protein